jgi:hypothetical protein
MEGMVNYILKISAPQNYIITYMACFHPSFLLAGIHGCYLERRGFGGENEGIKEIFIIGLKGLLK